MRVVLPSWKVRLRKRRWELESAAGSQGESPEADSGNRHGALRKFFLIKTSRVIAGRFELLTLML